MRTRLTARQADERLLRCLALRCKGASTTLVSRKTGAPQGYITTATNAIRDADVAESGEPREAVMAAYGWR